MSFDDTITISRSRYAGGQVEEVPIPRRLGDVRILDEIGRGGTGVVYKGRDEVLSRIVAVKFLSGAVATPDDPGFAEFLEGARSAATLHRTGLTTIYQAGVIEDVPYVIMQYVDGPTVSQLLRSEPLGSEDALSILVEAAELTAALHDHGIVHRDIKPSNMLVDLDGHLFLTDFGLAHRRQNVGEARPVVLAGTPAYMAPEMFEGQVSPRSDVYALGITGVELLTGTPPFRGTIDEVREKHQASELPADALKKSGAPRALIEALERATNKKAMYRYKAAAQFAREIRGACPDLPTPLQAEVALSQRATRWRLALSASPRKSETDTPRSSVLVSLHEHLPTLISQRRGVREGMEAHSAGPPVLEPEARLEGAEDDSEKKTGFFSRLVGVFRRKRPPGE